LGLIPRAFRRKRITMSARIFQRPKNAMQSGQARLDAWVLDFAPAEAKRPDPLMGWAGSGDMQAQVQLTFASSAAAQAYADKCGISAVVHATPPRRLKLQAYADNFR
jgi:hypothetical protein